MSGIEVVLAEINEKYGTCSIMRADKAASLSKQHRIPTGIFGLDVAMGGGIPIGKMITLVGEYSSGKSLIAHKTAAAFQRYCRSCGKPMKKWNELSMTATSIRCCRDPEAMRVVWFDAERSWINTWAMRLGIDISNVYVIRTEYAEQGIDVADHIIRTGECDLLVVDSVAALTPSLEITASAEKWQMGLHARLMNKAMRKWTSAQSSGGVGHKMACTIIMINQIRMRLPGKNGILYGSPTTSPGGKGIDFFTSIKCIVKKLGDYETPEGLPGGHEMEVAVIKNKTAPPGRTCLFNIAFVSKENRFRGSSNHAKQVIAHALFWKIIKPTGTWIQLAANLPKVQGLENAAELLRQPLYRPLLDLLAKEVWKKEVAWIDGTLDDEKEKSNNGGKEAEAEDVEPAETGQQDTVKPARKKTRKTTKSKKAAK